MSAPKPRRCSKRWLDSDCPCEVLCIIDYALKNDPAPERYDVFYAAVSEVKYPDSSRVEQWMEFYSLSESGTGYHGEMQAHQVAAYRYRKAYRYVTWSSLPEAVKAAVRRDIEKTKRYDA
jgi:hypothetical protein